jgi:uncharacterized protein
MFVIPVKAGIHQRVLDCFAALAMTLALLFAAPAFAQTFPANNGSPVVDQAGILRPEQVIDLKSKAEALYAQSGRAFAVATVKSLEGRPVDEYAYQLGRFWKLGSEKNDDGVLLLVAPNERKVAIATGYGAGEYMTDAMSGIIIRENILPHFKQDPPDYGGGIEAGADAIIKQMTLPPGEAASNVAQAEQVQRERGDSSPGIIPVIFWIIVISFIMIGFARGARGQRRYRPRSGFGSGISPWVVLWGLNELSRGSRRGGWGGGGGPWGGGGGGFGGGGGSFGGFGGGSFGGGGASGSW